MTPQEKAKELVDKYISLTDGWVYGIKSWEHKKQCALIAIKFAKENPFNTDGYNKYLDEIEQEIIKP